jgi:hypothetical protein
MISRSVALIFNFLYIILSSLSIATVDDEHGVRVCYIFGYSP